MKSRRFTVKKIKSKKYNLYPVNVLKNSSKNIK